MRVKVGEMWFDASDEALCVEFNEQDKINIARMDPEATKYAVFPDAERTSAEEKRNWMKG